jgi:hypothetical protein
MFLLYLEIGSSQIYEIFMGGTRLKLFPMLLESPFYLIWFEIYNNFNMRFLRSLKF